MLTDWIYWLSAKHPEQLLAFLFALLLTDGPRYALTKVALVAGHWAADTWRRLRGKGGGPAFAWCPGVCVVVAGYNEGKSIRAVLESLWGTYPRLDIVVVDDGSSDDMADAARRFADGRPNVLVLRRPDRGGKSSAMNLGLRYTRAEVVVVIDADSSLGPAAIWELVQPLRDPKVGAVGGSVLVRNPFVNLATWLQAYEYLSTIFVGRMVSARLGILGIVSGAYGAFRRSALERVGGWDAGPPEDLDLTLTLRKAGYDIAFAPYSVCYTDVPESWWGLVKQRLRWDRSGTVRNHCRKHVDLADVTSANFRVTNFALLLESWVFSVACTAAIFAWAVWFCYRPPADWRNVLTTLYLCYLAFELIQILATAYFSNHPARDLLICTVFFLVPLYQIFLLVVRLVATVEEALWRKSYEDNYVPEKVRRATWHW